MILCCGEALIDMVPFRSSDGKTGFFPYPGGSPYNTAIAIGRLGVPAYFLGRFSKDFFGDMLIQRLADNNVKTDLIIRSDKPAALAFVNLEAGKEPQYVFYTEGTADRSFSPPDIPSELPKEIRCILFGSIAMTMEPVATAIESLIYRETKRGKEAPILSVDPNIRPFMIRDSVEYIKRFERWVKASTIVKISAADLAFIYPALALEAALQRLVSLGPRLAVATLGPDGATALLRQDSGNLIASTVPAPEVMVVDTIGAGDAFHGALLSWLELKAKMAHTALASLTEGELTEALSFANKAASLVCTRPGAEPPAFAEVAALDL
ncbi:MAG: carbohydrate kinase [Treponema sp.]|jgi:fructokinase|nr:carbohydrate kinase [Treponema sp.]